MGVSVDISYYDLKKKRDIRNIKIREVENRYRVYDSYLIPLPNKFLNHYFIGYINLGEMLENLFSNQNYQEINFELQISLSS